MVSIISQSVCSWQEPFQPSLVFKDKHSSLLRITESVNYDCNRFYDTDPWLKASVFGSSRKNNWFKQNTSAYTRDRYCHLGGDGTSLNVPHLSFWCHPPIVPSNSQTLDLGGNVCQDQPGKIWGPNPKQLEQRWLTHNVEVAESGFGLGCVDLAHVGALIGSLEG